MVSHKFLVLCPLRPSSFHGLPVLSRRFPGPSLVVKSLVLSVGSLEFYVERPDGGLFTPESSKFHPVSDMGGVCSTDRTSLGTWLDFFITK